MSRGCVLCKLVNRGNLFSVETILEFIRDVKTLERVIGNFEFLRNISMSRGCVLCKLVYRGNLFLVETIFEFIRVQRSRTIEMIEIFKFLWNISMSRGCVL